MFLSRRQLEDFLAAARALPSHQRARQCADDDPADALAAASASRYSHGKSGSLCASDHNEAIRSNVCKNIPAVRSTVSVAGNSASGRRRAGMLTGILIWLPSMTGACQEGGPGDFECAPALVGVNVVRPAGRSTPSPRARRRGWAPARAAGVAFFAGGGGSVVDAGPGRGWSEVPMTGGRSAALDNRVAPECPPGPVCRGGRASAASWR